MKKFLLGALILLGSVTSYVSAKSNPAEDSDNVFDVSYGNFFSQASQLVVPGAPFAFELVSDKEHIHRGTSVPPLSSFTIKKAGHYSITYAITGHATAALVAPFTPSVGAFTIGLLHNGVLIQGSVVGISRTPAPTLGDESTVYGQTIIDLAVGDTISMINTSAALQNINIPQLQPAGFLSSTAQIQFKQLDAEESDGLL